MKRDEMVDEILTDLVMESIGSDGLFEEEQPATPHADAQAVQAVQAGALAAGKSAGIEAKAAGLDRNGVRFAVAQAVRHHTESWRQFRKETPVAAPKPAVDDEHVKRVGGLEKTVQKLQTEKTLDQIKNRVELAKIKADAKIEIIRMRAAQRAQKLTARRTASRSGRSGKSRGR